MNKISIHISLLLVLSVIVGMADAENLIVNGDFESGDTGFYTDYDYLPLYKFETAYNISAHSNIASGLFDPFYAHNGSGLMMLINGATAPNHIVWSQIVDVVPNTNYLFSIWVASAHTASPANLQFLINDDIIGNFSAPITSGVWYRFTTSWNSGSRTSAIINITDLNTNGMGNDFALDDISFSIIDTQMNGPPFAEAGGPYTINEFTIIRINAYGSFDPSGGALTYAWDWDGDGLYEIPGYDLIKSPIDGPSTRPIGLEVTNANGSSTDNTTLIIYNVNPIVEAGSDQTINLGDTANFKSTFYDVQADMNSSTAQINYGDGIIENVVANPNGIIEINHLYTNVGTYTVNVIVKDKDGGIGSDTLTITVSSNRPVAEAGGPYTVDEGVPITINGYGSYAPLGSVLTYAWNLSSGRGTIYNIPGPEVTITYNDGPRIRTIRLQVTDENGLSSNDTATISVVNVNPVVEAGTDQTVDIGDNANFHASFSDVQTDMSNSTAQMNYGDGTTENVVANPNGTIEANHSYANSGTYIVTVTVTDKDKGIGSDTLTVTVNNALPVAEAGGPYTVYEGKTITINGGSYDPSLTYAWDWNGDGIYEAVGYNLTRTPRDGPSIRTIGLKVTNANGLFSTDNATMTVNNVNPIVNAGQDQTINEGDIAYFNGSFSDVQPDMNSSTAQMNYGDGTTENVVANPNGIIVGSHKYVDNGVYTVTLSVTDKDGGIGSDTAIITVNNVAPTIDSLSTDSYLVPVNTTITGTGTFHDPGILDTFTAAWNWDDTTNTINLPAGSILTTDSHTYTVPGVYSASLQVTDKDSGADIENMPQYIVIYDPDGGFVTGGGWINSPAGAYIAESNLTGKANFGFVSKYQKGANVPTGQTEFQFKVADLNFHSTSYDWLVVAGARAQYKGSGTINGKGDYEFILTAIDGQINGGGGTDKFRIKIKDKATGTIVYDNQNGATDDSNPITEIAGGSIVIHM